MKLSKNQIKKISSLKIKKFREKEKLFLIEGFHLIEECLTSDYAFEYIITEKECRISDKLFSEFIQKNIEVHELNSSEFQKLSDTKTSQGIIGVVHMKEQTERINFMKGKLYIALDDINDPGNLGTILRIAYWFNVDGIVLSNNSVDLYNPKVLRASQGALFHLKIFRDCNLVSICREFVQNDFKIYLFDLKAEKNMEDWTFTGKNLCIFGNETLGISKGLISSGYPRLKLQKYSACDSLNVSVACAIVIHHIKKYDFKTY